MQRRTLLSALAAAGATTAAPWALAQHAAWPDQPLRWVVPYPAGGGTDVLARTVAEAMRQTLGQQIVVDNRPGASTNVGGQMVATAKPDGYTFMSADNAILAYNEHLFTKLPFNPEKDFTYVGGISRFPLALVVNPALEAKTVKEFLAYARANPGKLNYASPGNGSPHHLAMEMFKNRTKIFATHIPYRGAAPALQDVMGGQVPCMFLDLAAGRPAGARMPWNANTSVLGTPASASVGTSGSAATRLAEPMASARTLPEVITGRPAARSRNMQGTWPPITSCSAGAAPR